MDPTDVNGVGEIQAENTTIFGNTTSADSALASNTEWTNRQIILSIVLGLITIVTIVSNSLVIYIFATSRRKLASPTHLLLLNMAVSDLLVGIVVMPALTSVTVLDLKWIFGDFYCIAWDYVHFLLCGASMMSIIGVSIERYIGVKFPLKNKKIMTRKRVIMFMIIIWVSAAMLTAIPLTVWPKNMSGITYICLVNLRTELLFFMAVFVYWIPISFTVLTYYLIYRTALRPFPQSGDNKSKLQGGINESEALTAERLKQTRLTKRIVWITGVIILFYGPVFGTFAIKAFDLPYFTFNVLIAAGWIRYCCSTVNPFMYALAVPGYRQEFRERLFGVRASRRGELEPSEITSNITTDANEEKSLLKSHQKTGSILSKTNFDLYCTQCGNLMANFVSGNDARCNICYRKVLCSSWVLPKVWGTPTYFKCPKCPTIRFFDGIQACFCQNCSHKFEPVENRPPEIKLSALSNPLIKPSMSVYNDGIGNQIKPQTKTDQTAEVDATANINGIPAVHIAESEMKSNSETSHLVRRKLNDVECEKKVKEIQRLRESVIGTLMQRRSRLLSNASNSTQNNDAGKDSNADWMCIEELDEIVAQLESTLSFLDDTNSIDILKHATG